MAPRRVLRISVALHALVAAAGDLQQQQHYRYVSSGATCQDGDADCETIKDPAMCQAAASSMLARTEDDGLVEKDSWDHVPFGCLGQNGNGFFNANAASTVACEERGNDQEGDVDCLCLCSGTAQPSSSPTEFALPSGFHFARVSSGATCGDGFNPACETIENLEACQAALAALAPSDEDGLAEQERYNNMPTGCYDYGGDVAFNTHENSAGLCSRYDCFCLCPDEPEFVLPSDYRFAVVTRGATCSDGDPACETIENLGACQTALTALAPSDEDGLAEQGTRYYAPAGCSDYGGRVVFNTHESPRGLCSRYDCFCLCSGTGSPSHSPTEFALPSEYRDFRFAVVSNGATCSDGDPACETIEDLGACRVALTALAPNDRDGEVAQGNYTTTPAGCYQYSEQVYFNIHDKPSRLFTCYERDCLCLCTGTSSPSPPPTQYELPPGQEFRRVTSGEKTCSDAFFGKCQGIRSVDECQLAVDSVYTRDEDGVVYDETRGSLLLALAGAFDGALDFDSGARLEPECYLSKRSTGQATPQGLAILNEEARFTTVQSPCSGGVNFACLCICLKYELPDDHEFRLAPVDTAVCEEEPGCETIQSAEVCYAAVEWHNVSLAGGDALQGHAGTSDFDELPAGCIVHDGSSMAYLNQRNSSDSTETPVTCRSGDAACLCNCLKPTLAPSPSPSLSPTLAPSMRPSASPTPLCDPAIRVELNENQTECVCADTFVPDPSVIGLLVCTCEPDKSFNEEAGYCMSCPGGMEKLGYGTTEECQTKAWITAVYILGGFAALAVVVAFVVVVRRVKAQSSAKVAHEKMRANSAIEAKAKAELKVEKLEKSLKEAKKIVDQVTAEGGSLLNQYRIEHSLLEFGESIGEGAFGTVFRAVLKRGNAEVPVAVKTMRTTKITKKTITAFMKEIRIMAPLHHANLVDLIGGVWKNGPDKLCIVLEFCSKGSLRDVLRNKSRESQSWAHPYRSIVIGIAQCFKYLHHDVPGEALIHRDLKPANVLIADDMAAKVADFGESRRFDSVDKHKAEDDEEGTGEDVATMTVAGTPLYIAPELVNLEAYNTKADVYSFAILLLEVASVSVGESSHFVRDQFRSLGDVADGLRPKPPGKLKHSKVVRLVREAWDEDPRRRLDHRSPAASE